MAKPVGIDLGTTNSVVAYCTHSGVPRVIRNADGETITPSVVAFDPVAGPVVGTQAAQTYGFGLTPGAALFKRRMGLGETIIRHDGVDYTPEMLSAMVLGSLADDAASELGARPVDAVITVPAYFQNAEREATVRAAQFAKLDCLQLINEPTAAAITFRVDFENETGRILVYDLGGGTFDVSVLETGDLSKVVDTRGDPQLGGADWDQVLVDMFVERATEALDPDMLGTTALMRTLRREAEIVKKRLSSLPQVQVSIVHEGVPFQFLIRREDFTAASRGLVQRTLDLTEEVIGAIDKGHDAITDVLLVGGSTRMPMIEEALTERFGRPPRKTVNPDEAVALGAAARANALVETRAAGGLIATLQTSGRHGIVSAINDITNFSLGVIAVSEDGSEYINRIMIPRGAALPAEGIQSFRHVFRSGKDPQLELYVTQGEGTVPEKVRYLGLYTLDTLPGALDGKPCQIEIGYRYDASGIGSARARLARGAWVEMTRREPGPDVPSRFVKVRPRHLAQTVSILMIFDVSGSMAFSPIKDARAAARKFLAGFDPAMVEIGIGVVADLSVILLPPTQDYGKVRRSIDKVSVGAAGAGGGNSAHPFDDVERVLGPRRGPRTAVVLADGVWSDQDKAIARARACHVAGIDIIGIGFGGADKGFLDAISTSRDLSLKVEQSRLVETFGTIAQIVSQRSGLISKP